MTVCTTHAAPARRTNTAVCALLITNQHVAPHFLLSPPHTGAGARPPPWLASRRRRPQPRRRQLSLALLRRELVGTDALQVLLRLELRLDVLVALQKAGGRGRGRGGFVRSSAVGALCAGAGRKRRRREESARSQEEGGLTVPGPSGAASSAPRGQSGCASAGPAAPAAAGA